MVIEVNKLTCQFCQTQASFQFVEYFCINCGGRRRGLLENLNVIILIKYQRFIMNNISINYDEVVKGRSFRIKIIKNKKGPAVIVVSKSFI